MADESEQTVGLASVKPDYLPGEHSGAGGGFLPPLDIAVDVPDFRYAKLSNIVAEHVLPKLVALHESSPEEAPPVILRSDAIAELGTLVIGPDNDDAANFVLKLKDEGVSLDDLHAELLEPTARQLGELWNEDKVDFVDVTLGVSRLQRLVHVFEGLDQIPDYDEKRTRAAGRRAGRAAQPRQHHRAEVPARRRLACVDLRLAAASMSPPTSPSQEWFGVVGFSLGSDVHLDSLRAGRDHAGAASARSTPRSAS